MSIWEELTGYLSFSFVQYALIAGVLIVAAVIAFIRLYDKITVLPVELYQNRRLIWKLAKSDFKKRYAGSYMGAFWAMVQPVIT